MKQKIVKIKNYEESIIIIEKLLTKLRLRESELVKLVEGNVCDDYALKILSSAIEDLDDSLLSIISKDFREKRKYDRLLNEEEQDI